MEIDQPGNFICRFCKGSFTQAQHLHKHVQLIHTANPSTKNNRTCPICGTVFAKYEGYRTHLRHIHGQRNEGQIFAFKCFNDFFLWKTELEGRSSCKFSLHAAPKLLPSNERIHVYQCDGNGAAYKKTKVGSCSVLDSCAAMICATESMKNREIKVEYWNTHVGHTVPVEEDELNAAINSVQSFEEESSMHVEPTMHVMDMLNSIDQSIETGAEVFVTETIEEDRSLSPIPKKIQKNVFNIKKTKPSEITSTKTPPIVQNFSFKKDPSKKKESSIYSLASVACGKISANKAVKSTEKNISKIFQNSIKKNMQKSVASNPACEFKNIVNSISGLTEEETSNSLDPIPKSSLQNTLNGGQVISLNPSPPVANKKQIVYNWPVGKPLPTDWVFSDPPPSEEKSSKNSTEKENISSISNKIIVPLGPETNKSKLEKSVKPKSSKSNIPFSSAKSTSKKTSSTSASVVVTTNATQFVQSSVPLSTALSTVSPQIINSAQSLTPTQLVSSILPPGQTYLSVNNKLIPVVNNQCVLPPGLSSSVLVPILPKPLTGSLSVSKSSGSTTKEILIPIQPPAVGVVKQNTIAPLAGTVSTLSNSFSGSPLILLPCTNNSSPLILQSVSTASVDKSSMFMSSLLKTVTTSLTPQTVSSTSIAKSSLPGHSPISSSISTNLSKAVKVQKVSLPTASSSLCADNKNINSVLTLSHPSQVSSVVLNTAPISSTPTINIPQTSRSGVQKPGTYFFESSGELYMLEPLDEDLVTKEGCSPLTSTPKKASNASMLESFSKNFSPKRTTNESVLLQIPSTKTSQNTSETSKSSRSSEVTKTISTTAKKNLQFSENSDSSKLKRSLLKNQNGASIDFDLSKTDQDNVIANLNQNTEMTITVVPSQNVGEKEVSIISKSSPMDIRTKPPASGSSPLKYTPSLLTVKTVPSFSLHQSRPVTSTLNSFRTSSSLVASSTDNYASSAIQSATSTNGSVPLLSGEKEAKTSSTIESSLQQETCPSQNVEVKRNVTIKSVVQEKRSATDDDLEVMKKVKFYKLEMKYLACQEQCKKLKIELAKALSKNKELLQDIEKKKENYELEQNKEKANAVESQKETPNENKVPGVEIQEEKGEIAYDAKSISSLDNADSDRCDSVNEMETESVKSSNAESDKPMESGQVSEESTHTAKEICLKEHLDCVPDEEMDVDEDRKESTDSKEPGDSPVNDKDQKEDKPDSNVDIFTMVRASVLKNLYLTVEDLTEEKKQLQKDLEAYQKLDLTIVPSFEECEDSL